MVKTVLKMMKTLIIAVTIKMEIMDSKYNNNDDNGNHINNDGRR